MGSSDNLTPINQPSYPCILLHPVLVGAASGRRGNSDSFESCSHGAVRVMGRGEARRRFTLEDHRRATAGVECRKDRDVIDETPMAYKDIEHRLDDGSAEGSGGGPPHVEADRLREGLRHRDVSRGHRVSILLKAQYLVFVVTPTTAGGVATHGGLRGFFLLFGAKSTQTRQPSIYFAPSRLRRKIQNAHCLDRKSQRRSW